MIYYEEYLLTLVENEKLNSLLDVPEDVIAEGIEKIFIFTTIWTFGGSLDESKGKEFSEMLKKNFKKQMSLVPGF